MIGEVCAPPTMSTSITVTIANCINEGNINATGDGGGMIGDVLAQTNSIASTTITMTNCTNDGNIIGGWNGGGLVGDVRATSSANSSITTTTTNCFNAGNITASSNGGGLIGSMSASTISNTIMNSMNKGTVSAATANGIAPSVTSAANVVSMGTVSGSNTAHALWASCTGKCDENTFVLDGVSADQQEHTVFVGVDDGKGGTVFVVKDNTTMHVDQMLNEWVHTNQQQQQHAVHFSEWNTQLEPVVPIVCVEVGQPVGTSTCVVACTVQLMDVVQQACNNAGVDMDSFHLVDGTTQQLMDTASTALVVHDTSVLLCHEVVVSGEAEGVFLVEHGHSMASSEALGHVLGTAGLVFVDGAHPDHVVDGDTLVTADTHVVAKLVDECVDVVVEFGDGVGGENVTEETVKAIVVGLIGDGVVSVVVDVDDAGNVVRVVVSVVDQSKAQVLVDVFKAEVEKGSGCTAGVLCHATDVFVDTQTSLSTSAQGALVVMSVAVGCAVAAVFVG